MLVDDLFQQIASVRHKGILDVLGRDLTEYGVSGMGALRAVETVPSLLGVSGHILTTADT